MGNLGLPIFEVPARRGLVEDESGESPGSRVSRMQLNKCDFFSEDLTMIRRKLEGLSNLVM